MAAKSSRCNSIRSQTRNETYLLWCSTVRDPMVPSPGASKAPHPPRPLAFPQTSQSSVRANAVFSSDPKLIDAVVPSHAHIDHNGNLPQLVASGFPVKLFAYKSRERSLRLDAEKLGAHIEKESRARQSKARGVDNTYSSTSTRRKTQKRRYVDSRG